MQEIFGEHNYCQNKSVILNEEGYEDYIDFHVKNKVQLIASLPCYTKEIQMLCVEMEHFQLY